MVCRFEGVCRWLQRLRPGGAFFILSVAALCSGVSACATVHVTDGAGQTRIERHFGFVNIVLAPEAKALSAETWVLGFGVDPLTTSIGFAHTRISAFPADCRLVIWPTDADHVERWRELLAGKGEVCIVPSDKGEKRQ